MRKSTNEITLLDRLVEAFPEDVTFLSAAPIELRIDDRESDDICYSFCEITLKVTDFDSEQFQLILDNVPWDEQVEATVAEMSPIWQTFWSGRRLTVTIRTARLSGLKELAKAIRRVVGRGKRYLNSNWKWVAKRAADSLEQLAAALSRAK